MSTLATQVQLTTLMLVLGYWLSMPAGPQHLSCAGSFFDTHGIQYVCVSGRSVRGDQRAHRSSLARYSFNSYKQVSFTWARTQYGCPVLFRKHAPAFTAEHGCWCVRAGSASLVLVSRCPRGSATAHAASQGCACAGVWSGPGCGWGCCGAQLQRLPAGALAWLHE